MQEKECKPLPVTIVDGDTAGTTVRTEIVTLQYCADIDGTGTTFENVIEYQRRNSETLELISSRVEGEDGTEYPSAIRVDGDNCGCAQVLVFKPN